MNLSRFNQWLTLASNLGVLLGIVFLILEMSQANRIAVGNAETEFRNTMIELGRSVMDNPDVAEALSLAHSADAQFSPTQQEQMQALVRNYFAFFMAIQAAYDNELISRESFDVYLNGAVQGIVLNTPALWPFWERTVESRNQAPNEISREIRKIIEGR